MRLLKDLFQTFLIAFIIFILISLSIEFRVVPSESMEPSLLPGQRLMINKLVYIRIGDDYIFHPPSRGEIITFYPYADSKKVFVKRVIAQPGEWVEIKNGKVFINDKPLYEPYIKEPPLHPFPKTLIPPEHYFVLGDNRNNSMDSRAIGPIPIERVIGKVFLIYWPPKYWGKAPNYSFKEG